MIPRIAAAIGLLAASALASETLEPPAAIWGFGPFDFRNEHIVSLTHLTLGADSARTSVRGGGFGAVRVEVAQTSHLPGNSAFVLDAETIQASLIGRYGVLDWLELGFEMPVVYRYGGILDWSIETVEDSYDKVRKARRVRARNLYDVEGTTDRGVDFEYDEGFGFSKLRISAKAALLDDVDFLALSLEPVLALPTATSDFGTEGLDLGLRLVLQRRFGRFFAYLGGSGILIGPSDHPIQLETLKASGFAATEFMVTAWLSIVIQFGIETPTTGDIEGKPNLVLWYGGGVKLGWGGWWFEVGAAENGGDVESSMDVALHVGVGYRF